MKEPFIFRAIPWFIGIVAVFIAVVYICLGVLLYKATNEVGEHGLKTFVERIWCGSGGCK